MGLQVHAASKKLPKIPAASLHVVTGVFHGSELPLVWGSDLDQPATCSMTPQEKVLRAEMQQLWAQFVKSGVPHPEWPRYQNTSDQNAVLQEGGLKVETGRRAKYCDFWERLATEAEMGEVRDGHLGDGGVEYS